MTGQPEFRDFMLTPHSVLLQAKVTTYYEMAQAALSTTTRLRQLPKHLFITYHQEALSPHESGSGASWKGPNRTFKKKTQQ